MTNTVCFHLPKRSSLLRVLALFCMVLMFFVFLPGTATAETPAEKYQRLKEELQQTRDAIKGYENNISQSKQHKAELERQKAIIDEMVEINKQEIARTEEDLTVKEAEIATKRQIIYENDQLLQQRLVAIYKMSDANAMGQLLAVESFPEMVQMLDGMRRISKHDTDLLDLLNEQREQLEAEQADIDAKLEELKTYYAELEQNQADLIANIMAADASITSSEAALKAKKQVEGDQYAALIQAQREMQAIAGRMGGSSKGDGSTYVGGVFTWPVPGYFNISCHFGSPDPNGAGHRGMDIATNGAVGPDIVACGDGTVIVVDNAHSSYGKYIVVDHGDGVKTLYAHCSGIAASVGEKVKKGKTIAFVGSTGFSTGPHLHLEVHAEGGLQNPANWLKG